MDVRLKSGNEVPEALVNVIMNGLHKLQQLPNLQGQLLPYDLIRLCRDPERILKAEDLQILIRHGLVKSVDSNGHAHIEQTVRDVILSAATGDGLDYRIGSPLAE